MEQRQFFEDESLAATEVRDSRVFEHHVTQEEEAIANGPAETVAVSEGADLTALLQQEVRSRLKEPGMMLLAGVGTFLALLCGVFRSDITHAPSLSTFLLFCFGLMGAVGWGTLLNLSYRSYRRKRAFTDALSRSQDRKQVRALIWSLDLQNMSVRNLAKHCLIELLPTLRASDASLLGMAERKILLRLLVTSPKEARYRHVKELFSRSVYRREVDLRLAILKALEQVGGDQEIAVVERLAHGVSTLSSALTCPLPTINSILTFPLLNVPLEIREAARACLPFLQLHADEQRAGAELLRASSLPATSAGMLLRPATTGAGTPPEQLLRSAAADEPPS